MLICRMRAGFAGSHISAFHAEKAVFEKERGNSQILCRKVGENLLCFIGTIVVAYPGVIPADNKMRAAVILRTMAWKTASLGPA